MKKLHQPINLKPKTLTIIGGVILLIIILLGGTIVLQNLPTTKTISTADEKNVYVEFLSEIYDKIQTNYWEIISDEDLFKLYKAGVEKLEKTPEVTIANDQTGMRSMVSKIIDDLDTIEAKKEFTVNLATIVLYNLQPLGRSGLYNIKKETELWNNVKNIDPETDLYDEIGVDKEANTEQITQAAEKKASELNKVLTDSTKSEEEKQVATGQLAKVERAQETLTQAAARATYNQSGVEATVYGERLTNNILHLKIKKMSPTTLNELNQVATEFDQYDQLDTLILDLRDNIGGSIDLMPYLLGPFIGPGQYAYETYHQGEYEPYKTKIGWLPGLVRYKQVVILQNEIGQSSAEVMAATLKKYNVGILVGTKSRGWGTIEAVFDIDNQIDETETYKMFLVHSVTLRDDNQPIEGRGIDPLVNINDTDWIKQLSSYINNQTLVNEVKKLINN